MKYKDTLMNDLLFKETFANPDNRRQLEFLLEQILEYPVGYLHNKLEVGEHYYELGKTIQINFIENSKLDLGEEVIENFYITSEHNSKIKLGKDRFCVKVVQIDKARELDYTKNVLEKWLKFIGTKEEKEREKIAKGDELLMELHEWIHKYVNDEEKQEKLNKWNMLIAKNHAVELERMEIAKNMLKDGISKDKISGYTGLSVEEIEKLKEKD